MGRLKPGLLHKQSLPSETEEIQRAEAGFLCDDALSTALKTSNPKFNGLRRVSSVQIALLTARLN
ncbi:MAG: hypothetical protein RLZZ338_1034 [Cyanobacteriota bacterium]